MELILNLYRRSTLLYYRANNVEYTIKPLVILVALREYWKGQAFSRVIKMEVTSTSSILDIKIDGLAGQESLSNYLYKLLVLIRD